MSKRTIRVVETVVYELPCPDNITEEQAEAYFCAQDIGTLPVSVIDRQTTIEETKP